MKIGDECYVHGYVDEIRNDTIIIRNEGGYFGTAKSEVLTAPAEYVRVVRCKDCKHWLPHTQFGYDADYEEYHNYCNRHLPDDDFYAFIKEEDDFCSWAERKEE